MVIGAPWRWSITLPANTSPSCPGERSNVASGIANLRTCMRFFPSCDQSWRVEEIEAPSKCFVQRAFAGPFDADGADDGWSAGDGQCQARGDGHLGANTGCSPFIVMIRNPRRSLPEPAVHVRRHPSDPAA